MDTTAASNRLRITETRGSTSWVHTYEYTAATNTWTYTSPGNLSEVSTRIVLDGTAGTREYITTVKQPGGPVIARNTRKYKMYSWGEGLIEKTDGSGTSLRTTTYTYTANGYANGTRKPLEKVNYPDGGWVRYEYDATGRTTKTISPHGNTSDTSAESLNRVTEYDYSQTQLSGAEDDVNIQPTSPRVVTESLLGQEIGRTYTIRKTNGETHTKTCPNPGAAWNATNNLLTITRKHTATFAFTH